MNPRLGDEGAYEMSPDECHAEKARLFLEHQRLTRVHSLLVEKARRWGEAMQQIGSGLVDAPERVRIVMPPGALPVDGWIFVTTQLPTPLQIERIANDICSAKARLDELKGVLDMGDPKKS